MGRAHRQLQGTFDARATSHRPASQQHLTLTSAAPYGPEVWYFYDRAKRKITRIGVPVLVIHGAADRVVPPQHAREMVEALVAANKPHRYRELPLSAHEFGMNSERIAMMREGLTFVQQHLLGVPAPATP